MIKRVMISVCSGLAMFGVLMGLALRIARQFTDREEARQYLITQAMFAAGFSAGGGVMLSALIRRLTAAKEER